MFQYCRINSSYDRAYPLDGTADGRPRQRWPGAGRHSGLARAEDKLLFVLVYLKTYPPRSLKHNPARCHQSQVKYLAPRTFPNCSPSPAKRGASLRVFQYFLGKIWGKHCPSQGNVCTMWEC
jgi:hypothetical protein